MMDELTTSTDGAMPLAEPPSRPDRLGCRSWFDDLYAAAAGDRDRVPWSDGRPHSALVRWLDAVAPRLLRCGARIAVPACGLGEDAVEIASRGYDVTAFDVSPRAIEWARDASPSRAADFHVADLFDLPVRWRHRFDLVVEVNDLQALVPAHRGEMLAAMAELLAPHGHLLAIGRHVGPEAHEAREADDDGPPWPLTTAALLHAAETAGLEPVGSVDVFTDSATPPRWRFRGLFVRGS